MPPDRGRAPPGNEKRRPGQEAANLEIKGNRQSFSRFAAKQQDRRPSPAAIRAGNRLYAPDRTGRR